MDDLAAVVAGRGGWYLRGGGGNNASKCSGLGMKNKSTSSTDGAVAVSYTHLTLPTIYSV